MIETLTAVLIMVTAFYSWVTFKIMKANESVLLEMKEQHEDTFRPYISISPAIYSDSMLIYLEIKNSGKTSAENLKLEIDKNFYQFGEKQDDKNLKNLTAFTDSIDSFAPNAKMVFYLATGPNIFGPSADEEITPKTFTINTRYKYLEKEVEEKTIIDLRPYLNTALPPDPIVSKLKDISKNIERIKIT